MDPFFWLIALLSVAFVFGELSRFFKLPRVLGYMLAGISLAQITWIPGFEESSPSINFLKDLAVTFLFFYIGLGINLKDFRKEAGASIKLGILTTLVSFAGGTLFWLALGNDPYSSFVIGICASVSAQAVCMMVLEETGLRSKKIGRDIVEAGIIADIIQLLCISLLFAFIPSVAKFSLANLAKNWAIFLVVIFGVKLLLFPLFQRTLHKENEDRITFFFGAVILSIVIGYLAEYLGMGSILGAIFAGALIRQFFDPKIVNRLAKDFKLIGFGFLVPLLFVLTGYLSQTKVLTTGILLGLALAVITILGNIIGSFWALKKRKTKERVMIGVGLSAKGDIEVILATILLEVGIIDLFLFNTVITMSLITMILSPCLFYLVAKRGTMT